MHTKEHRRLLALGVLAALSAGCGRYVDDAKGNGGPSTASSGDPAPSEPDLDSFCQGSKVSSGDPAPSEPDLDSFCQGSEPKLLLNGRPESVSGVEAFWAGPGSAVGFDIQTGCAPGGVTAVFRYMSQPPIDLAGELMVVANSSEIEQNGLLPCDGLSDEHGDLSAGVLWVNGNRFKLCTLVRIGPNHHQPDMCLGAPGKLLETAMIYIPGVDLD